MDWNDGVVVCGGHGVDVVRGVADGYVGVEAVVGSRSEGGPFTVLGEDYVWTFG